MMHNINVNNKHGNKQANQQVESNFGANYWGTLNKPGEVHDECSPSHSGRRQQRGTVSDLCNFTLTVQYTSAMLLLLSFLHYFIERKKTSFKFESV